MTQTLQEDSSFVKTTMMNVILVAVSMISVDFRNSLFHALCFENDVDIQESNFSNCYFDDSHLETTDYRHDI